MANLPDPVTRKEQYLSVMAENTAQYPEEPITREEMYLDYLCKNGTGGTVTPEQIQAAVDQYLEENPVSGMTEEQIEQLNQATEDILTKVDKDQGTENAGKVLGIGSDGMVTPVDGNIQSQTTQTDHGTADTTFTLPPNQYHTWGEVAALTLTLATETTGVVNEYHFAFDSGDTATTLSLPEGIQTDIVVEPSTHYECSIIDNYMTFRDWPVEVSA